MLVLLFIAIVPTLLLAASFGVAYPIVNFGKRNLEAWRAESNSIKKLFCVALFFVIVGIGVGFVVLDWIVNLVFATAFFRELPGAFFELLTTRIQRYLNQWQRFNRIERAYIRFVVKTANRIDKSPHFYVPRNTV